MEEKTIHIPGWKIVRTIGKGSFGTVYEIVKEDEFGAVIRSALKAISIPETDAEIKDYRGDGYDDASITALFKSRVEDVTAEFKLMNKLKGHTNIVSFEDYSIVQHDNVPGYDVLIRMELLTSLPDYINRQFPDGEIPDKVAIELGIDICRALELCSKNHIIHRDIKPMNIFVNENRDFKLGDFGIAKTSDHTTRATKTGTFGYMAPEVYLSKPYNASVDIYSLGLVMYWMLNERRGPFLPLPPAVPKPSQNAEALDRRMSGEPLPVPKHGSEELKRIVLKACAFDPKDRYANPTEMKRDLERLAIRSDTEAPHTETEQADNPFSADEDEKTFGVFGGKPSKPEVPPTEEDEKTFGIFGTRQPKEPEFIPVDSEATVSAKKAAPMKPAEKPVEPKKEIKPVKTEPEQKEQPVQAEVKPVETKNRKKSKLPVILSIAAAVVIAAVVLIVVLAGKGKTPSQPAEQPTSAPIAEKPTPSSITTTTTKPTGEPIPEPTAEQITDVDSSVFVPETMVLDVNDDILALRADESGKLTVTGTTLPGAALTAESDDAASVLCGPVTVDDAGTFFFDVTIDASFYGISTITLHASKDGAEDAYTSCIVSRSLADRKAFLDWYSKNKKYVEIGNGVPLSKYLASLDTYKGNAYGFRLTGTILETVTEGSVTYAKMELADTNEIVYVGNLCTNWAPQDNIGSTYRVYTNLTGTYRDTDCAAFVAWFVAKG